MSTVYQTDGGQGAKNKRFKLVIIALGGLLGLILIIALLLAGSKKIAQSNVPNVFYGPRYEVSYPNGFTNNDDEFKSGNSEDIFKISRFGAAADLPAANELKTTLTSNANNTSSSIKATQQKINGKETIVLDLTTDNQGHFIYYIYDSQYVWQIEFLAKQDSALYKNRDTILKSFKPRIISDDQESD